MSQKPHPELCGLRMDSGRLIATAMAQVSQPWLCLNQALSSIPAHDAFQYLEDGWPCTKQYLLGFTFVVVFACFYMKPFLLWLKYFLPNAELYKQPILRLRWQKWNWAPHTMASIHCQCSSTQEVSGPSCADPRSSPQCTVVLGSRAWNCQPGWVEAIM